MREKAEEFERIQFWYPPECEDGTRWSFCALLRSDTIYLGISRCSSDDQYVKEEGSESAFRRAYELTLPKGEVMVSGRFVLSMFLQCRDRKDFMKLAGGVVQGYIITHYPGAVVKESENSATSQVGVQGVA
ncbi:MAG TPA: hypothetical protein DHN29_21625 [Cytophagales bacterium]|nr:hypothetical protein [Cytophagales bacterium]|tara:strand:+ start:1930 stop:2322 length:393 start_codon:yes stop_codon:yes gene_type:complete